MRVDLGGKIALVTGAAQGVGRAIADRLAREGAEVIALHDAAAVAGHSRIDILVTTAAPDDDWDRAIEQALSGVMRTCRAAADIMIAAGAGRIVNVIPATALVPMRSGTGAAAAGAGIANFTRALALELGRHGIGVNAVAHGAMDPGSATLSHVPLGRPARMEDIAHAALFLASPASSYITGHVLTVDGGWTAGYVRNF